MKPTVIKCGGALDPVPVCADLARLAGPCVLVHGGAPQIARLAAEMGIAQRTLLSPAGVRSRYTDAAMLDVVTLAMTGRAKPLLLAALTAHGVRASARRHTSRHGSSHSACHGSWPARHGRSLARRGLRRAALRAKHGRTV